MQIFANTLKIYTILKAFPNTVITRKGCGFCDKAKNLLDIQNIEYNEIKSEQNRELTDEVKEFYQYKTYPMLFLNKSFIGGHDNLKKLVTTGEIEKYKKKLKDFLYSRINQAILFEK